MILVQRLEMSKACYLCGGVFVHGRFGREREGYMIYVYCLLPCQDEFTQIRLLPFVEYHAQGKVG